MKKKAKERLLYALSSNEKERVLPNIKDYIKMYPLISEGYDILPCIDCGRACFPDAKRTNGSVIYSRHRCAELENRMTSFEILENGEHVAHY